MRIGTMLSMPGDPAGVRELVARAVAAESAGYASCWLPQVDTIDALTVLALAGQATHSIELGSAVVPTYPRHPTVLAAQALTAQDASGNRLALGVGLSHRFIIEGSLGLDYSRPIPHTRDYLTILSGLLRGGQVTYRGAEYRVNAKVSVAGARPPPLLVAALGPAMLRLCGRLADGTITWMGGLDYLRDVAVPALTASAQAAGRPSPRVVAMVPILLTPDTAAGREQVDAAFGTYRLIPSYRATLERGGAKTSADVALVGDAATIEAGARAFAAVGVSDLVAAIPSAPADAARATGELLARLARVS